MANYVFETITSAQATSYSSSTDSLTFSNASAKGNSILVTPDITAGSATVAAGLQGVTLYDPADGVSKSFGSGLQGETVNFADGSVLQIATNATGDGVTGSALGDGLYGFGGADTLSGLAGNDLILGNKGDDSLVGGDGSDTLYGGQGNDIIDATGNTSTAADL